MEQLERIMAEAGFGQWGVCRYADVDNFVARFSAFACLPAPKPAVRFRRLSEDALRLRLEGSAGC